MNTNSIFLMNTILFIITNIMMLISIILAKKTYFDREKSSPFECGFDPQSPNRMPFSLHFFLIAIIFLIFDVEIVLILPLIVSFSHCNFITWILTSLFFFMILLLGLYHEWNSNILKWTI
uniref:NADH-ubiquinone oxidoreductase chain 3 n=1 Tax=Rhyacophila quadrifida TaxID=2904903 RepID=A0A9E8RTA8_9NEOP|nr:NADH dehydrogenase subunit 3 [Rhyacophila quadrifida]UZZ44370.1 NADH dehydrogenase subunit 3 [Rhyacophila quadrifida]